METTRTLLAARDGDVSPDMAIDYTVAESHAMRRICAQVRATVPYNMPVLIRGEAGTGRRHIARHLHQLGPESGRRFVELDCAAIAEAQFDEALLECTNVMGSHGGCTEGQIGTLFLREVADLDLALQSKLVHVLRDRRSEGAVGADVRIVASSAADLGRQLARGTLRNDLFYRLCLVQFHLPPLRERSADIVPLAETFLRQFCTSAGLPRKHITAQTRTALLAHDWPGNARQLQESIEWAALSSGDGTLILPSHLPAEVERPTRGPQTDDAFVDAQDESAGTGPGSRLPPWHWSPYTRVRRPPARACHSVRVPHRPNGQQLSTQLWACQYPSPSLRSSGPDETCGGCPQWAEIRRTRAASSY